MQLVVARSFLGEDGVPVFSEGLAVEADVFRRLGSPRRHAADVSVGVTAARARDLDRDSAGIPGVRVEAARSAAR